MKTSTLKHLKVIFIVLSTMSMYKSVFAVPPNPIIISDIPRYYPKAQICSRINISYSESVWYFFTINGKNYGQGLAKNSPCTPWFDRNVTANGMLNMQVNLYDQGKMKDQADYTISNWNTPAKCLLLEIYPNEITYTASDDCN